MKRLLITSTDLMMIQFLVPHVRYLSGHGFQVDIGCSEVGGRMEDVREAVAGFAGNVYPLRLERSPFSPANRRGYGDLRRLLKEEHYDIIWTNEPVMGVMTRLAARGSRKKGTKVVYMCHGFHFYKGAPLPSWLIYYPIERLMSHYCDAIVTINHEDEARARTFHCPRVAHIHGIGVDTERLRPQAERSDIRRELGLTPEDLLILSVGELNENKNHQVILRALAQLKDDHIHYILCGRGDHLALLQRLSRELGLEGHTHFLGYRKDVPDILNAADIYAHPSRREGLGLACLEAMHFGLPLVTSNVQGIPDYVKNGITGFLCAPTDVDTFASNIQRLATDAALRREIGLSNQQFVKKYAISEIQPSIARILCDL